MTQSANLPCDRHGSTSSEEDTPNKLLQLGPSCYRFSCLCGHGKQVRDFAVDHRRNKVGKTAVTIHPKVAPVPIQFV